MKHKTLTKARAKSKKWKAFWDRVAKSDAKAKALNESSAARPVILRIESHPMRWESPKCAKCERLMQIGDRYQVRSYQRSGFTFTDHVCAPDCQTEAET